MDHQFESEILNIKDDVAFNRLALQVFEFQRKHVPVYATLINSLPKRFSSPGHYTQIPFLPIEFFKSHRILHRGLKPEMTFYSSGTTGMQRSRHWIAKRDWYQKVYTETFKHFYGNPDQYCILGLLPNYLEQKGSSLVEMVKGLIQQSNHMQSGFYLNEFDQLFDVLQDLKRQNQKTILFGVTFGLLDFSERYRLDFPDLIVMETGGMKGRRKELLREEVHARLKTSFGVSDVHSEYGMTELLSQAYSKKAGIFYTPAQMKLIIRDTNDPFSLLKPGQSGGINLIDLGNLYSCSFIATQDLGKTYPDGSFEVLGRFDNSDIRGCSLMVE